MNGELDGANQVVASIVAQVVLIVDIVDDNFVVLTLLEVVLNFEVFNPLGFQAVPDDFGPAEFFPNIATREKRD